MIHLVLGHKNWCAAFLSFQSCYAQSDDELVKIRLNLDDEGEGETLHTTGDSSGRYTKLKERQPLKERPDFDGGCFDLLNRPSGSTMTKQVLPLTHFFLYPIGKKIFDLPGGQIKDPIPRNRFSPPFH